MSKGPLRRVLYCTVTKRVARGDGLFSETVDEVLECGHTQYPVHDIYGETNAYRRRCGKCAQGLPPNWDIEQDKAIDPAEVVLSREEIIANRKAGQQS